MRTYLVATMLIFGALAAPAEARSVQERIYPAPTAPLTLEGLPAGAALEKATTSDGLTLTGIRMAPRPGMPTLLVFHGNGSSAADSVRWLGPLVAKGFGIVAAEYRGYSGNPGRPDEDGLTADAEAFYALAKAGAGGAPVWVIGHSLGGGVAFDLAKRERLDLLVTVGAFTRLRAMAPKLARAFIPGGYDNLAAVAGLDEPWFLVHGTADSTVPAAQGEALHSAAGAARRSGASFVVLGADHKPGGTTIAAVADVIASWVASGRFDATRLPATVKLIPFGQSKPINP